METRAWAQKEYFNPGGSFEYEKLYNLIHELQHDAVVGNNRHEEPLPGEDFQGFEQDLPGGNTAGFNTTEQYNLPKEVCMTINDNWGIHFEDENHKSTLRLVHDLVKSASVGANYLLNVGPTAEGTIIPVHAQRLRAMGDWLTANGEAVYETREGLIPPTPETVSTFKAGIMGSHFSPRKIRVKSKLNRNTMAPSGMERKATSSTVRLYQTRRLTWSNRILEYAGNMTWERTLVISLAEMLAKRKAS